MAPPKKPTSKTAKKPIAQYSHPDKTRKNNPPVGLVTPETDRDPRFLLKHETAIESGDVKKIAMWLLDPDYDGRSLYPRQVFFPMAGESEGWARLAKNLRAEIDEGLIEAYRGTVSLPFEAGKHKRAAVKIVDDRGIESLKIIALE